jgi:STAS-like domain of unknown function (DUF4325)
MENRPPDKIYITVATDFSKTPGPRSSEEGRFSGEEFLNRFLVPHFEQAIKESTKLVVDLDGAEGYATSFLEAAFGGLARAFSSKAVLEHLEIKSADEPYLDEEITNYIRDAEIKSA